MKNQYIGGLPKKGVYLKGGDTWQGRGGGFFEGDDTLMHTVSFS